MIIPLKVDVPLDRRPFTNYFLIASIIAAFGWEMSVSNTRLLLFIESQSFFSVVASMWLHGDIIHLVGNLLFLYIFGNAVCGKIGNLFYLPAFLIVGLLAELIHFLCDGTPSIGASGAINGIVGMYLIFFPLNSISCLFIFWVYYIRTFSVASYWMILLWFGFDIWGAVSDSAGVAYFAHIGGFLGGAGLASLLLVIGLVRMAELEKSLFDCLGWRIQAEAKRRKPDHLHGHQEQEDWLIVTPQGLQNISNQPQRKNKENPPRTARLSDRHNKQCSNARVPSGSVRKTDKAIRFRCPCGAAFSVAADGAGKVVRCKKCRRKLRIPGSNHPG